VDRCWCGGKAHGYKRHYLARKKQIERGEEPEPTCDSAREAHNAQNRRSRAAKRGDYRDAGIQRSPEYVAFIYNEEHDPL
jgi:hypothetical protein